MAQQANRAAGPEARTPEVDEVLKQVERHLEAGEPRKGLETISRSKLRSPWLTNAAAVCQLRLGNATAAVEALRSLVVQGSIYLREDAPAAFKVNFAAALLGTGNLDGFLGTLGEIGDNEHPSARKYRDSFRQWKGGWSPWERFKSIFGGKPARPFEPGFPPGDLT